jgi:DNA-directed RNA polymerase specialized sigma24 family protein
MAYVIDWSPEGAAFYAKNSLQEDHLFIEHVMTTNLEHHDEEDKAISWIDGMDDETDYTDERAVLMAIDVYLPHSYRVVYSLYQREVPLNDIATYLGIDYYLAHYRLKQAKLVLADIVETLSDYQMELVSMRVMGMTYKYIGEWFGIPARKASRDYHLTLDAIHSFVNTKYGRRK